MVYFQTKPAMILPEGEAVQEVTCCHEASSWSQTEAGSSWNFVNSIRGVILESSGEYIACNTSLFKEIASRDFKYVSNLTNRS